MTDTGMEPNEEDRNQSNETGHVTAVATPPDFAFANLAEPALFASTGNVFNGDAWKSDARVTPFGANNESSRPLAFAPVAAANREGNFFKAARWAPDGSCVLASTNDNCLRVFGL